MRGWFLGLTIVLVVWTGIQIQFGWFDIGRLVSVVMLLGFAWFVFENYYSPTPVLGGNNRGFAHFIVQGGQVIGDDLIASADDVFLEAVRAARRDLNTETRTADSIFSSRAAGVAFAATVLAGAGVGAGGGGKVGAGAGTFVGGPVGTLVGAVGGAVVGGVTGAALAAWSAWQVSEDWFAYQMRIFMVTAMKWTGLLAMWLIYWMIMAQYLWGMASLSLLSLIGPIFIPFILLPQSDWLFWGWLKALIQATFHMITSAALYAVVAVVLVTPLERLRHLPLPADPGGAAGVAEFSLSLLLGGFPTLVMSFLAALQVGSLSGALLSGGAVPGAGLAGRVGQVLAGARAATSRFIPRPAQMSDEGGARHQGRQEARRGHGRRRGRRRQRRRMDRQHGCAAHRARAGFHPRPAADVPPGGAGFERRAGAGGLPPVGRAHRPLPAARAQDHHRGQGPVLGRAAEALGRRLRRRRRGMSASFGVRFFSGETSPWLTLRRQAFSRS